MNILLEVVVMLSGFVIKDEVRRRFRWVLWAVGGILLLSAPARGEDAQLASGDLFVQEELVEVPPIEVSEMDFALPELELFTEALLHVRKHYVKEKDYQEIITGALHGMLDSLDAHSSYMEPEEFDDMRDDTSGKFSGIGIHIGIRDGFPTVIAPIEGTPAFRAGLQSGDRILKIDGEEVGGYNIRNAVNRLRGERLTEVTLTIQGAQDKESRDVTIVRENIVVPSVLGTRMVRGNIGYTRITQFSAPTAALLDKAVHDLLNQGLEGLVLDLRGNPGGLLSSAIDVSSMFLERGEIVVKTRGRADAYGQKSNRSSGNLHVTDIPMAILVNGGSASASEIVAGALQDHGRAVLVGSTTYGKASVQSLIPIGDDKTRALRLTIAHYYTPNDREIHGVGIEPDIPVYVKSSDWSRAQIRRSHIENPLLYESDVKAEYEDVVDHQLQRAIDILQAVNIFK